MLTSRLSYLSRTKVRGRSFLPGIRQQTLTIWLVGDCDGYGPFLAEWLWYPQDMYTRGASWRRSGPDFDLHD